MKKKRKDSLMLGLQLLKNEWKRRATFAFKSAENEPNIMGKKLMEHGAMCYLNCATEMERFLADASPDLSQKPLPTQKSKTSPLS